MTKSYHHGDLRNAIIREALRIIAKDGVEALTLREVSKAAGVSHTAPYRHFPNKSSLLAAVAEEGFKMLLSQMEKGSSSGSPFQRLVGMGTAYLRFARKHPESFRIMFGPELSREEHTKVKDAAKATLKYLEEAILNCCEQGYLKAKPPDDLALLAWSLVHGLSNLVIDGQLKKTKWDSEKTEERMVTAFLESFK